MMDPSFEKDPIDRDSELVRQVSEYNLDEDNLGVLKIITEIKNIEIRLDCFNHVLSQIDEKQDIFFVEALKLTLIFPPVNRERHIFRLINSVINYRSSDYEAIESKLSLMDSYVASLLSPAYRYITLERMYHYSLHISELMEEENRVSAIIDKYNDLRNSQRASLNNTDIEFAFHNFMHIAALGNKQHDWHSAYELIRKHTDLSFRLKAYRKFEYKVREMLNTSNNSRHHFYPTEIEIHYIER